MLSKKELIRYQRQLLINNWNKDTQEKLKSSKVFVAGAGGLGSPLLYYLAIAGIGNITICDYDKIVLSNLNRQILHPENRIGNYKVDSASESLLSLNSEINIIKSTEKISEKTIDSIIKKTDLIIDCLDNFKTRHVLNKYSVENKIPLIHAGVSGFQGQITFIHPPETACLACFLPKTRENSKIPILGATAGVIGSLQAIEAIKYLTGIGNNLKNQILFWDGTGMNFGIVKIKRNKRCKICAGFN